MTAAQPTVCHYTSVATAAATAVTTAAATAVTTAAATAAAATAPIASYSLPAVSCKLLGETAVAIAASSNHPNFLCSKKL